MTRRELATPGRLDSVLASLTGRPRAEVQRWIDRGAVTVDGARRSRSHRLTGGEAIEFDERDADAALPAGGAEVPIRWRDGHLVVVAKPAGLVVHPTEGRREGTLVNALLGMGVPLAPAGGALRPGIVHRLDAGTSGLMIVACDDDAFTRLQAMFRAHEVRRTYRALVRGSVVHDRFAIDAPLGRRGAGIRIDLARGRDATTDVEVEERLRGATLLEVRPRTGRTHQIRVHLAAIGHPILGDGRYGGGGDDARRLGLQRPFLHSARLTFTHPISGERIELDEPLPADLVAALDLARRQG